MTSLIVDFPRNCSPDQDEQHDNDVHHIPPYYSMDDSTVSSSSSFSRKKRRTVQFSPTSTMHCYNCLQDHALGDCTTSCPGPADSWYSLEEEHIFKLQAKREIAIFRLMKESGRDIKCLREDEDKMCPFGLENSLISREYTKRRAITKRLVTLAVLTEQARSNIRPLIDDNKTISSETLIESEDDKWDRIAAASRQHSEWSRKQAQAIGSFQANDIRQEKNRRSSV